MPKFIPIHLNRPKYKLSKFISVSGIFIIDYNNSKYNQFQLKGCLIILIIIKAYP